MDNIVEQSRDQLGNIFISELKGNIVLVQHRVGNIF